MLAEEQERREEEEAKRLFERKQREKNMSFAELLDKHGDQGDKFSRASGPGMHMHIRVYYCCEKIFLKWKIAFDLERRLRYIIIWRTFAYELKYNVRI